MNLQAALKGELDDIRRESARRDAIADERMNCLMTQMNEINHRLNDLVTSERG